MSGRSKASRKAAGKPRKADNAAAMERAWAELTAKGMFVGALEIVELVQRCFESGEENGRDPVTVLREALRSASDDIELLEPGGASEKPHMAFLRAQQRIKLALKLAEFRERFPGLGSNLGPQGKGEVTQ